MHKLGEFVFAVGLAIMSAAFPAMAQQSQQQMPMMGPGMMMGGLGMMNQGMMGQAPGGMMGQGMGGCPMMGGMMGPGMQGMMGQGMGPGMMMGSGPMMEGRLAYLKAELAITDAQASAWDGYVSAVRARQTAMQDVHADMIKAMQSGSALERMDARIKAMETMVDSLKALKPATETLYAVLSDEQKKEADQLLGGSCGMM
jgi:hypothetical protein